MRNVLFLLAIAVGILVQLAQTFALAGRPRVEPEKPAVVAPGSLDPWPSREDGATRGRTMEVLEKPGAEK